MYLLDAKRKAERKAERKAKQREARERQERKREERRQHEAEQRLRRQQQHRRAGVGAEEEERQLQRALQQSKAEEALRRREEVQHRREEAQRRREEAQRLQEEAELQEALRRSVEEDQCRQSPSSSSRPQQRPWQHQQLSRPPHQSSSPRALSPTSTRTHNSSPQESADDPERLLAEWRDAKVSCKYVGTFEAGRAPIDREAVKAGISVMTEYIEQGRPAHLLLCLEGIKVIDGVVSAVVMAHALKNITMCTVIKDIGLFGFVARDPQGRQREQYCHVFHMNTARQAQATHAVVSKAFKLAFYKHRTRGDLAASTDSQQAKGRQWAKHNPLQGAPHQDMRRADAPRTRASPTASSSPVPAGAQSRQQQHQERQAQVKQRLRQQRQHALQQQHHHQQQQQQPQQQQQQQQEQGQGEAERQGAAPGGVQEGADTVVPSSPTPRHAPRAAPLSSVGRCMSGEEQALANPDRLVQPTPPSPPPLETLDQEMQELELLAESQQDEDDGLDDFLRNASWYQAGLPRDIAKELLDMNDEGAFLVRESQSHPGHFALTIKGAGRIHNFIIKRMPQGFMLGVEQDGERVFHDLGELILHHAEHRGVLPCRLNLDATNALSNDPAPGAGPDRTSFIDPDYESLRDIIF